MKRMRKSIGAIPTFANDYYSSACDNVFEVHNRKRVAVQIESVLKDFYNNEELKKITCLDIGCSTGVISNHLSSFLGNTTGIDVDKNALSFAQKNYKRKNLHFSLASAENLPYEQGTFDLIICHQVLSFVNGKQKLIDEAFRVLKPGGKMYISTNNLLFPFEPEYRLPFIQYAPDNVAKIYLSLAGHKKYYLAHYDTYWSFKKLCKNFKIHDYTMTILRNPDKYKFSNLEKYKKITNFLPSSLLQLAKFFVPTFIFVLKKE